MRHNIVHLIRGAAKQKHETITTDLAENFDLYPLHDLYPPHLTLKRGFESDEVDMADLYDRLHQLTTNQTASDYSLSGFGHFGEAAIYVDVQASHAMSDTVMQLLDSIRDMPGMNFHEYDNGGEFHASVAMSALKSFNFQEVWDYIQKIEPFDMQMKFDNVTVLKKESDVWVIDRVFEIGR